MEDEKGGEDVVICLRDYKECWQNMTADCVCAHAFVCLCVCEPWPNPMNSDHNNIRDSFFVTELEQKMKNISVQPCSLQVNFKLSV